MDMFDNLKQKVTETAKFAAKKSNNIMEIAKLKVNISSEEDKIKKTCYDIGKTVYKVYLSSSTVSEEFINDCEKIKSFEMNIDEMKKKVRELRSIKICTSCGSELDDEMTFCYKCGSKQEVIIKKDNVVKEVNIESDENSDNENSDNDNNNFQD